MRVSRKRHTAANIESLRRDVDTDVHTINLDQLLKNLDTDRLNGLTTTQAKTLLQKHGANKLTPPRETPEIYKLIHSLCGGFSLLIWVGAILCFANYLVESNLKENGSSDHLWLGTVLLTLIFVTGIFSYYQNAKSSKIMASFKLLLPERAAVIRDGERKEISVTELVVGDIVVLQTGNQIPADIRIFECQGMKVDNASLTGENIPVPRSAQVSAGPYLEAKNMAFFSSNVVEGLGKGVVVGCGDQTAMGRVAGLTSRLKPRETPISTEIKWFMRYISCWAVFLGVSFFGMSLTLGYTWIDAMVFLIGIIVANVPEGLLATVTVSLTLTAKRMASKNCLVKNLESVETLGSTSVICSDKTGTLTQNKMTVRHLWYNGQLREVMASDTWRRYIDSPGFSEMAKIASLCNRAEWASPPPGPSLPLNKRKILGDASETALLRCMEVLVRGGAEAYRSNYIKVFEVPFNSTDKFQANIHLRGRSHFISLKGAPESVLSRCSTVANGSTTSDLEDETRDAYTKACQLLANNGERVLGFADFQLPPEDFPPGFDFQTDPQNFPLENLRLVGLISMMDPPRPGVADAVYRCRCAGIKVIMVTGDHPDTARAIAKFVGIITESDESLTSVNCSQSIVITGTELRELEPLDLDKIIKSVSEIVFARTSPVQKLQIVESCQRLHHITAVTGDGVNDSPALKKSDVGIAMGIGGSDVSRQVADIILLDDNFSSITTGIEEGRRIFDNLKSSIAYTLASNVPEIVPFLIFIVLGIPLPVGIICVLCIDLGTDMWPAISLAYEKPESDIMSRMPRIPHVDHLVSRKLVFMAYGQIGITETAAGFFSYLMIMAEHGFLPGKLIGIRPSWDSKAINDLEDSYGQEWTYDDRKVLEYTCHTAYFVSIVIVQWVDVVICKTRRASIFRHGMNNWVLNFSLIFETGVALFVSYAPHMDVVLKTYPLRPEWWLYPVPFAILMFAYDELRKMWIRNNPGGWWDRETSY